MPPKKIISKSKKKGSESNPAISNTPKLTFGGKAADAMTNFMGSWPFIIMFAGFLMLWVLVNMVAWKLRWDPYPFILLNLFLSCLATFQAPIIMMSQNRQSDRDRITAKYDYAVNRKAEREIQELKKSIDSLKRMVRKIVK
jgi:uncharacterized membrane protein